MHKVYCKPNQQIIIYGEWAGKGVQKSVGISELSKGFYIFDCKVYDAETDNQEWIDVSDLIFDTDKVFNIYDFPTWNLDIDFNIPDMSQNKLVEITEEIERECPVSKDRKGTTSKYTGVYWNKANKKWVAQITIKGVRYNLGSFIE